MHTVDQTRKGIDLFVAAIIFGIKALFPSNVEKPKEPVLHLRFDDEFKDWSNEKEDALVGKLAGVAGLNEDEVKVVDRYEGSVILEVEFLAQPDVEGDE